MEYELLGCVFLSPTLLSHHTSPCSHSLYYNLQRNRLQSSDPISLSLSSLHEQVFTISCATQTGAFSCFSISLKGSVWSKKSFPFFAENMIIRSILNLWWRHSEILKLILGVVRGMFTKRLKRTRRLLYTVKSDFFEMTALHSKC